MFVLTKRNWVVKFCKLHTDYKSVQAMQAYISKGLNTGTDCKFAPIGNKEC